MKLKIKLKENNIFEINTTPGSDVMADVEAQKATDEYDPEEFEQEVEDTVGRVEDIKTLKDELSKGSNNLPMIKILYTAHIKAVSQNYNIDFLWETIRTLLIKSKSSINQIKKIFPGMNIGRLVDYNINMASSLENSSEDFNLNAMMDDILTELIDSDTNKEFNLFRNARRKYEQKKGEPLTAEEEQKLLNKFDLLITLRTDS